MIDKIYEHLKTKKKYNTLQLKYDVKCDELQAKIVELNTEKRIRSKQQELYEAKIKELTEKNVELESKLAEVRKELKKCIRTKKR
jgi:CRISPR/Cas system-associated endoribonuclease Cas2